MPTRTRISRGVPNRQPAREEMSGYEQPRPLEPGAPGISVRMAPAGLDDMLIDYLRAAQALERVDLCVLDQAGRLDLDPVTTDIFCAHRMQTRGHLRLIEERLSAHRASPSDAEDLVRVAGLSVDFDPDAMFTPAQLAVSAYALENLEIGIYHVLIGVARQLHDRETEAVAERILEQEETAAELVASRITTAAVA